MDVVLGSEEAMIVLLCFGSWPGGFEMIKLIVVEAWGSFVAG